MRRLRQQQQEQQKATAAATVVVATEAETVTVGSVSVAVPWCVDCDQPIADQPEYKLIYLNLKVSKQIS